ncbi:MAG: redox-regulated ATPase YchF [Candidatus Gracilibacteria bacterium]|nr:redox-regulated ATPase YchF [Candidatus Gracilibacteria bacterium]
MKVGIVGLPNVGKSTLFNALTKSYGAEVGNFPFCTIDPNVGIVNVNDERLEKISKVVNTQKIIPATVEFVDIAGLVAGASKGEGLGNKFLANIRETDAILQVVRGFEDENVHHVNGEINPKKDIEIINSELIIADLETLERKMGDNGRKAKSGDKECIKKQEIYEKLKPHLEAGNLAITLDIPAEDRIFLKDSHFLTNKPFIYAVNLLETDLMMSENDLRNLIGITDKNIKVVPISAKLEYDMLELTEEERKEFLVDLGLTFNPVDVLIKTCFDALGLQYYFTAGEIEARAWTIRKGALAPEAAGEIHTDFQKKFIKAEVVNWEDLLDSGSFTEARSKGKVKMEGKDYVMQDGDVVLFKIGG